MLIKSDEPLAGDLITLLCFTFTLLKLNLNDIAVTPELHENCFQLAFLITEISKDAFKNVKV